MPLDLADGLGMVGRSGWSPDPEGQVPKPTQPIALLLRREALVPPTPGLHDRLTWAGKTSCGGEGLALSRAEVWGAVTEPRESTFASLRRRALSALDRGPRRRKLQAAAKSVPLLGALVQHTFNMMVQHG